LQNPEDPSPTSKSLASRTTHLKRGIARLIDAYSDGLVEKDEFEPKMRQLKERLEAEEKDLAQEEAQRAELRLVIGQLADFSQRLNQGLDEADWCTRREIIRALVKRIEVSTVPFVKAPNGSVSQDCRRRADPFVFLLCFSSFGRTWTTSFPGLRTRPPGSRPPP
jgi:hypothetical protein